MSDSIVDSEFVVLYLENIKIQAVDLARLEPGEWLNDTIIDFYLCFLRKDSKYAALFEKGQKQFQMSNTMFYPLMARELNSFLFKWEKFEAEQQKKQFEIPKKENEMKKIYEKLIKKFQDCPNNNSFLEKFNVFCSRVPKKGIRLFETKCVIFPINYNNNRWKLAIIFNLKNFQTSFQKKKNNWKKIIQRKLKKISKSMI